MQHLLDLTLERLTDELTRMGEPAYRARQILGWIYRRTVCDFAEMTDLPASLRAALDERLTILTGRVARRSDASDGVVKLLIEWPDAQTTETLIIPGPSPATVGSPNRVANGRPQAAHPPVAPAPDPPRATACVSTQVGCAMRCEFCASGLDGLKRNLTAGEIVEQVLHLQHAAQRQVTHVVFMGTGEPLANYDATVAAIRSLTDPDRFGLSARRIAVSTVGLPGPIRRLADEGLPITLAISLHAPTDALRRRLMPAAARVPIARIVEAAAAFYESRHREVTLEYVLLAGLNDTPECAAALAGIARQLRCNVNLIPYNPVAPLPYCRPSVAGTQAFARQLAGHGVNVQLRRPRGLDADAACGQLRHRSKNDTQRHTREAQ